MIAMNITDIKGFMSLLLTKEVYDEYLLSEGSVTTFCTFSVDGTWQRDFFDPDHTDESMDRNYILWRDVRGSFFNIIKGKHTPLCFKFVFLMPPDEIQSFLKESGISASPSDIFGLYMNYRYDGTNLLLTTGTSLRTFTKDRTIDNAWDLFVAAHLRQNGIASNQV